MSVSVSAGASHGTLIIFAISSFVPQWRAASFFFFPFPEMPAMSAMSAFPALVTQRAGCLPVQGLQT
jgi:hypothetical protein